MVATTETLFETIATLPAEDRDALLSRLWQAYQGRPYGPEWDEIVRRRSAEIDAGTAEMIPHSVIMAEARKRLGMDG